MPTLTIEPETARVLALVLDDCDCAVKFMQQCADVAHNPDASREARMAAADQFCRLRNTLDEIGKYR